MAKKGDKRQLPGDARDPDGFVYWVARFLEHQRVHNYAERTVVTTESALRLFVEWAHDRDLLQPKDITKPVLDLYQRWLFHLRKESGRPLTFSSQRVRLQKLRGFFKWLTKANVILSNPASELEMPRVERRLPRAVLSETEVEKVLAQPDCGEVLGLRDRTMMEVLYSTGIRRHELSGLDVFDVDRERETVTVRMGKGKKDRTVPIGGRALGWIARYMDTARPLLRTPPESNALFLSERGERIALAYLTSLMKQYVDKAKLGKTGACHIFRHTMATLMLEGGADIRHIQEILGHVETSTTAIYTRISIRHLKQVHDATHPAAKEKAKTAKTLKGNKPKEETAAESESGGAASASELHSLLVAEALEEDGAGESSDDEEGDLSELAS